MANDEPNQIGRDISMRHYQHSPYQAFYRRRAIVIYVAVWVVIVLAVAGIVVLTMALELP